MPGSAFLVAATSSTSSSGSATGLLLFLAIGFVFVYFLIMRPQRRRVRTHQDLVSTLSPGDEVVTVGGIVGYVKEVEGDAVRLEIAPGCVIRVVKQAIGRKVVEPSQPGAAGEDREETGTGNEAGGKGELEEPGGSDDT